MNTYDVIIIGGSYAGLSAALALGRSLRNALVIDGGERCNRFTPHSQNFLTHDGEAPHEIAQQARREVQRYSTVQFIDGVAVTASKTTNGFVVNDTYHAKKLILAGGLKDIMPDMEGFEACWGKSVIHCPYCHGYEHAQVPAAVITNGDEGFHYSTLVYNLNKDLTIFTNGPSTFTPEQIAAFKKNNIGIIETPIKSIQAQSLTTKDGAVYPVQTIYHKPHNAQHTDIPQQLGCELNEQGLLKVNDMRETNIKGVYACGDNSAMRSIATAVYTGSMAGVVVNKELAMEDFY